MFRIGRLSISALNQGKRGYGSEMLFIESYMTADYFHARFSWKKRLLIIRIVFRKVA
jgi:hypothetical protein